MKRFFALLALIVLTYATLGGDTNLVSSDVLLPSFSNENVILTEGLAIQGPCPLQCRIPGTTDCLPDCP